MEVRPEDEQRQDEQRPPADAAARRVDEEPEDAGEERQRRRLRADRPAPRAGEDREEADRRRSSATTRRSSARSRTAKREREQDEARSPSRITARMPGERRGRRRRRPARATAGRSTCAPRRGRSGARCAGRPFSTTSRPAISVSHVSPTTIDGAKTERRTIPTRRDEQDREGARLEDAAEALAGAGFATPVGSRTSSLGGVGVRLKSDTGGGSGGARRAHERIFARGSERLSGPWARVGRDPRRWPAARPADDASSVTVVPDSSVVSAAAAPRAAGRARDRPQPLARGRGCGRDPGLGRLPRPRDPRDRSRRRVEHARRTSGRCRSLGAVACMGVVYWLQAARWRRIADTRLGQRRFVEMVVAGVAVNNVLPGRVGDLLRARWVSRGAYSGGRGLATVMLDRALRHPRARRLPARQPAARDGRGLGRPDRRRLGRRARRGLGADPRGARRTRGGGRGRGARTAGCRAGSCATRSRASPIRCRPSAALVWFGMSVAAWGAWALGRDPRRARRRRRALARRRDLRHGGAQPRRRDPVVTRVRRHLPVARRVGARAVRDRPRGGARVRDLHAGRLVRPDDDRRRGDPRRARQGRVADGADLRLRLAALALTARRRWCPARSRTPGGAAALSRRRGGAGSGRAGRPGAPRRRGSWRRACGRRSSGGTSPSAA